MSEVSLVNGHIDNEMSDEEIIKILKYCEGEDGISYCNNCPLYEYDNCVHFMSQKARELINRYKAENEKLNIELKAMRGAANSYKAEVERLQKRRKPTETSGFKIENGKVVFYTNMLNGYRHELKDLEEVVDELNLMLQEAYKTDEISGYLKALQERYKTTKSEAIKEFAERLKCNASILCDRVTGLPCSYTISNYNFNRLIKEMTESK